MAAPIHGVQAGIPPYQVQGATGVAPIKFGNVTSAINIGSTAQQVALPQDDSGTPYAALQITASGAVWFCFNTGAFLATPGGTYCYLITVGSQETVIPPKGAVGVSVIGDTGTTAASFSMIGLF